MRSILLGRAIGLGCRDGPTESIPRIGNGIGIGHDEQLMPLFLRSMATGKNPTRSVLCRLRHRFTTETRSGVRYRHCDRCGQWQREGVSGRFEDVSQPYASEPDPASSFFD
jgi:hypothetical protein